jgi:hypothetical protein
MRASHLVSKGFSVEPRQRLGFWPVSAVSDCPDIREGRMIHASTYVHLALAGDVRDLMMICSLPEKTSSRKNKKQLRLKISRSTE